MPLLAVMLALVLAAPDRATQSSPGPSLQQFVATLQQAASRNDRRALAGMMRFPLEVTAGGLQIPVADANAFVTLYDSIITPGMKAVIARARVPAAGIPVPGVVTGASGSIAFENAVFIAPEGGGFRITKLGVPLAPASSTPGVKVARQLTFRVGRPTLVNGAIEPGARDLYEFNVAQGALVDARLTGVAGRTVMLRVVNSKTGEPVDARADAGTRVWTGRPAAGQYRIEVVRQPGVGTETLLYTLSVEVR